MNVESWPWWMWALAAAAALLFVAVLVAIVALRDARVRLVIQLVRRFGLLRSLIAAWGIARDPRTPTFAKWLPVPVLLYLALPIDLVPDFIPVLGQADDVIVVGSALWVMVRLIPMLVFRDHLDVGDAADPGGGSRPSRDV